MELVCVYKIVMSICTHICICVCVYFLYYVCIYTYASLVVQLVKNLPTVQEAWVRSLGWEDPLEEGMATYSCILAWRIPMDREAWRAPVHGDHKESDTNEQRSTHINTYMYVYVYYWLSLWFRQ